MPSEAFTVYADGYNIIHAWPAYSERIDEDLDLVRNLLIEQMAEYKSLSKNEVTLVFDAHKVKGRSQVEEEYKGIRIVYTKPLETADLYIERALLRSPPKYRVMVVSNDSMIQQIILGRGGIRMTVQEFMTGIEDQKGTLRRNTHRQKTAKTQNLVSVEEVIIEKLREKKRKGE